MYLNHLVDKGSPKSTLSAYGNDLSQLCSYLKEGSSGGDDRTFSWSDVNPAQLAGFVASLEGRDYAPTTLARKVQVVKGFFSWLAEEDIINSDPTRGIKSPRIEDKPRRTLNEKEVTALLAAAASKRSPEARRDHAMLRLLCAGLKVTELVSLDNSNLDLASSSVRVISRKRVRIVPVDTLTFHAIEGYLEERGTLSRWDRDNPALFVNHRGERLTRQGIWLILRNYAKAAGLWGEITPHTLRRSLAVHLLANHADPREVQKLLGIGAPATQVYRGLAESKQPA